MELVLLTFGLLFAIIRISARISYDNAGKRSVRRYGSWDDYKATHCDYEMEKKYRKMVEHIDNFESVWDTLEKAWKERRLEISQSSDYNQKIWSKLMERGRVPFDYFRGSTRPGDYGYEMYIKYNFKEYYEKCLDPEMQCRFNHLRAVHCLMWIEGKKLKKVAEEEWSIMTNPYRDDKEYDPMCDLDKIKAKEEYKEPWW